MATEGGQEGLQYGIQEVALGNDPDWGSSEFKQNVGAGIVMGGVFAGAGAGVRGMVDLANATKGEEGKKLDPLDVNVEIGESFDLAFPKIERVDPILEENYLSKIREAMPAEMKTIMDNNTQVYLDKGESEKVAVYKALDDLMGYPEFRDLALDILRWHPERVPTQRNSRRLGSLLFMVRS